MKCSKCDINFPEREIQESHDVPKYMFEGITANERKNKADKFGRHWLCKKCHDIYEKTVAAVMIKPLPQEFRERMITSAQHFAQSYFKEVNNDSIQRI